MKSMLGRNILLSSVAGMALMGVATTVRADPVATISGCYDCGVFDTPSLVFHLPTGVTFTGSQIALHGYQGVNNGLTATVNLGTLLPGDNQFFWGSLPGAPQGGPTAGSLTTYDYDDQYIGTSHIINDPTCGGVGCVAGGGAQWYAQVGNFDVTFTATFNGQPVFSVFSPTTNATGSFVAWEGLDANGFSEHIQDDHGGSPTGILANIAVGTPPVSVPGPVVGAGLPGFFMALGGLVAFARRRRKAA